MSVAFLLFVVIVAITLVITYFASRAKKSSSEFYTASGSLGGIQNGFAIAGDYMSAASFLGIAGSIALAGFDGFFYSIGFLVAYLVVLYLVAEPMRNLGKFTMGDMISSRFENNTIRATASVNTVVISIFYMIAQLVGAGSLIKLLLGWDYWVSVLVVGVLMTIYVAWGGMRATSWVQIVKAILLLGGTLVLTVVVLAKFNFNISDMFSQLATATPLKEAFLNPGNRFKIPLDTISLNLALVLGTAGLPHILTRFFTVKDAKTARKSVVAATWMIGLFYVMTLFLGFGAAAFVGSDAIKTADAGGNMAAPLLAKVLGGDVFFAFISAVAFATILAVVTGLVLTSASSFSHDLYNSIWRKGTATEKEQVLVARWAAVGVSVVSMALALAASKLNVAFLVALAFAIAASANLPVILFTIFWRKFNTTGAVVGMLTGLISAIVLVCLSPSVWSAKAGAAMLQGPAWFPLANPGIVSIPLGFLGAVVGSLLARKKADEEKFQEILVRGNVGV